MGVTLSFEIEGEKQISVELGIMADHVRDWEPPLKEAESLLLKSFDLNFDSRGKLFQGGWPKRKLNKPWPLLEKTGEMRKSFEGAISGDSLEIGNTSKYFKFHQSKQPHRVIPRRIMMKIDDPRRIAIIKAFQAYILDQGGTQRP